MGYRYQRSFWDVSSWWDGLLILFFVAGMSIGAIVWYTGTSGPNIHSETVIHYVTVTRNAEEVSALKQCSKSSNNEQFGAPGSPKVYGECVYWVEKAFRP